MNSAPVAIGFHSYPLRGIASLAGCQTRNDRTVIPRPGAALDLVLAGRCARGVLLNVILVLLLCPHADAQISILTQHNDNSRSGQNIFETQLTTANVNANQFGKLFSIPTDGQVYAQPLYVSGLKIDNKVHNVLIVATENDSVYALDADSNTGTNASPLWKVSMLDAAHGAGPNETPMDPIAALGCTDLQPQAGITSTPVVDLTSNTIYLEAKSTDGSNYYHRLHALDLFTGNEKSPGPVVISATVDGSGDGSTNGKLPFDSLHQQNRDGLLLLNGTIFLGFGSHCDYGAYHGWLFAYDVATFKQTSAYVTTPNGGLGGLWMGGAGIAADSSGNIFIASGNGDFDTANVPPTETGDTILKFGTANQLLTLLDYFTPQDQAALGDGDHDLGSGGVLLLPDQSGAYPHLLIQAGKEGLIYVVNRDQMTANNSHYCSGCTSDPEIVEESATAAIGGVWGMPSYWNSNIFYWGSDDVLKSIPISNGLPDFTHITSTPVYFSWPGATPSISSNGATSGTGIVWAVDSSQFGSPGPGPGPAVLHAFDAANVSNELWNSSQAPNGRDRAGNAVKFATPTIVNGKVYIGTSSEVDVYSLFSLSEAPIIATQPPNQLCTVGQTATFSVVAGGAAPLSYQWQKNGANISGATSASYTTPVAASADNGSTFDVIVSNSAGTVTSGSATLTVYAAGSLPINYSNGFASTAAIQLNGDAVWNQSGPRLRLTDNVGTFEAGSAFFTTPVNIQAFHNSFSFQLTNAEADGFTFTIQNLAPTALGPNGGGLGYGGGTTEQPTGIATSVAVKFDLYSNAGEGPDSTGEYSDGVSPTVPAVDMTASGVNLHSGDIMNVQMNYDGTTLSMNITDVNTNNSFTTSWAVNIPATVGSNTAYVGFTGGTGGLTAIQEILNWSYNVTGNNATSTNTASFVGNDVSTQGDWPLKYGSDGYAIANSGQSLPTYAALTLQNGLLWTWSSSTEDPRALRVPGNTSGIASTWYNNPTFSYDITINDGKSHQLALYAVDWDTTTRAETVQIVDGSNPSHILDTENLVNYSNGAYLIWSVSGHVIINLSRTAGPNAVISGIFFGSTSAVAPTITSANSVSFTVGTAATFTVTATGNPAPELSESGGVPAGMTFNTSNGVLTGVPASGTGGTYPLTFTASNGVSPNATQGFTLSVSQNNQAPAITSPQGTTFTAGSMGTFTVTATGYPTPTLRENGSLPVGVTFNSSTDVLSGTPATGSSASYPITFTASNGISPDAVQSFSLVVSTTSSGGTGNSVTFLDSDTTTQGNWQKNYGTDGYVIANCTPALPAYLTESAAGSLLYTWAASTNDLRALELPAGSTRIASTWYNKPGFSYDLNITDGNAHRVAVYAMDWDSTARAETIQVVDGDNPSNVLDTESIANFQNGIYLVWTTRGHVKVNVTWSAGANAVVSGIFFGEPPAPPSPASANFVSADSTTEGNWPGKYGSDGYSIVNYGQNLPGYAALSPQNALTYTWNGSTADSRALKLPNSSFGIASTWYNNPTFDFDLALKDGNSHQIALYLLDWDGGGSRAETIQIVDANSNAVLSTQSASSFANGVYLIWNISGDVKIIVTATSGANAVVSGVFFK